MKLNMETENFLAIFFGKFLGIFADNMLPSKLIKISSFIVDPF